MVIVFALFFYIILLENNHKREINWLTYRLKHNIAEHDRKITLYSVLLIGGLICVYELMRKIGDCHPLLPLLLERKDYYAIVISICSLFVAVLLSLKLDTKKIESGEDFLSELRIHAKELQRKSTDKNREVLHIYSPNINIGVSEIIRHNRDNSTMFNIISECNHVLFSFHCPNYSTTNSIENSLKKITSGQKKKSYRKLVEEAKKEKMLDYLLTYFEEKEEMHGNIYEIAYKCATDLMGILKLDNVEIKPDENIQDNMVGFRSKYEMVLGQYSDIVKNKHTGEVDFHGEVVTIPEFIDFVPKIENWD